MTTEQTDFSYDLVIIGAGSAGCCAALAAARENPRLRILLVEKQAKPGGTAVTSGVSNWEPGLGSAGFHTLIARRLIARGKGCVGRSTLPVAADRPFALSEPCTDPYEATLQRAGLSAQDWRRFHFNPDALADELRAMLDAAGIDLFLSTEFHRAISSDRVIRTAELHREGRQVTVSGRFWIDSSADIVLARSAGCASWLGEDPVQRFQEPSAPLQASRSVNGVSLIFRLEAGNPGNEADRPTPGKQLNVADWSTRQLVNNQPVSFVTKEPDGTLCFNMLPTMEGAHYLEMGDEKALAVCKARVYHYVRWLQTQKGMSGFRLQSIAQSLGVREKYRLQACYVLREQDILQPFGSQTLFSEAIAFADHPLDLHGQAHHSIARHGLSELQPYAIPYSCLLPREKDNFLVACRGAGFSHIAASSCRLTRTMMALGEAAGTAATLCLATGEPAQSVNRAQLRDHLAIRQLEQAIRKQQLSQISNVMTTDK
jgi:hypothetical protein